jgi:hypothetical protein
MIARSREGEAGKPAKRPPGGPEPGDPASMAALPATKTGQVIKTYS